MFGRHSETKKRGMPFPFMIFRLLLSLTMLLVLSLGLYQAFKYFSGTDPLELDPQTLVQKYASKDGVLELVSGIIGGSVSLKGTPLEKLESDGSDGPEEPKGMEELKDSTSKSSGPLKFKFVIVADPHNDNDNLTKALSFAKSLGASFVVGLGDYSEVGTMEELAEAKKIFQAAGLPFYTTAGDHDLWDSRNREVTASSNFSRVFGAPYGTFLYKDIRFVLVYNADSEEGLDSAQWSWLEETLRETQDLQERAFVFLHIPLYHPTSDRYMGSSKKTGGQNGDAAILSQAERLRQLFKERGVLEAFAGDIHAYSRYEDPKYGLKTTTVGALTRERNSQSPRFVLVDVFEDGNYNIEDLEVK